MTVPTRISEMPITQPDRESLQESFKVHEMQGYSNFTDIGVDFCHILDRMDDSSEFRLDGLRRALKFSTMNKIRMFTSWMGTKMTDSFFELYAEDLLALTSEQLNDFRQADMIRMMGNTSSPPPGPTTPMTTLSGYTEGTVTSESQAALNNFKKSTKRDASAHLLV